MALPEGPLLGVDYGAVRVGLAVSNALGFVHPLGFVAARPREALLKRVAALAGDRRCVALVVGLPLNMDGSEGPSAKAARELGAALAQATGLPVEYCDERLTSWEADRALLELGLNRRQRKGRVDAVAAARMLQTCVDEQRQARTQARPPAEAVDPAAPPGSTSAPA